MATIKTLIADDHLVVREGTRRILEREDDIIVVAEAGDGEEAVEMCRRYEPDVAIMDINMPKLDGIEATERIKAEQPGIAILILTAYDDDQFVFRLMEAGAAGYLLKSVRGRDIVDAVRAVNVGESVLHPAIAKKVLDRYARSPDEVTRQKTDEVLTERELEVLRMATMGLSNQEIADKLFLSLRTVQAHLGHIFNKLQVSSRTEAVVRALKEGWITLSDIP